jgi:hypothetical protein
LSPIPGAAAVSVPQAEGPSALDRPACTPSAIRAVLALNATPAVLARYDQELDAAFEQARHDRDLTPLMQAVRRWWFEADVWRDPAAQHEFLARLDQYLTEGPPPEEDCMTREEIRARYGV